MASSSPAKAAPKKTHCCDFPDCGKTFARSEHLKVHKLTHSQLRPHKCDHDDCDKAFTTSSQLTRHKLTHSGEKPYPCDHPGCDKAFTTSTNLKTHRLTHAGARTYRCDHAGCDKAFVTAGSLAIHKLTHTGVRRHRCDHAGCDKAFSTSSYLAVHKLSHSGLRPHRCDHAGCDSAFTTSGQLAVHKLTHSGEKPYRCDFPGCDSAYAQSGNLASHKLTHFGLRPFHCDHPGCDDKFTQRSHLAKHKASAHTAEGQARRKLQEQRIVRLFTDAGIDFTREHKIDFTCMDGGARSYARIDFVMIRNGHIILKEVDEGQHKFGYGAVSCDMKRMTKTIESLAMEGNTLPVIFIRYNPHAYTVDGVHVSMLKKKREAVLLDLISNPKSHIYTGGPLAIQYMYYDTTDGVADVTKDPEYNTLIAECCLPPIV
jgi:hypothetical protein